MHHTVARSRICMDQLYMSDIYWWQGWGLCIKFWWNAFTDANDAGWTINLCCDSDSDSDSEREEEYDSFIEKEVRQHPHPDDQWEPN